MKYGLSTEMRKIPGFVQLKRTNLIPLTCFSGKDLIDIIIA